MATILESVTKLLQSCLGDDPPRPDVLRQLDATLPGLMEVGIDPTGDGIDAWLQKLNSITGDPAVRESLIVRALQIHTPRLAEALTLAGIIAVTWNAQDTPASFTIDWARFDAYTADPGAQSLNALLTKAQSTDDVKALQALLLMLATSPQGLVKLEYRREGFAALPLEGRLPGASLQQLIDMIQSPLRMALPVEFPVTLEEFLDLVDPAAQGTMGFIGTDGPVAPSQLDDLAFEVQLKQAENVNGKTLDSGNGWTLKFETDGSGQKTYRLQFGPTGLDPSVRPPGMLGASLTKTPAAGDAILIGEDQGTHLSIASLRGAVRLRGSGPLFEVLAQAEGIELVLEPDFLSFLSFGLDLPSLLTMRTDFKLTYVQGEGLTGQFDGDALAAISVRQVLPLDFRIGGDAAGVQVDQVVAELKATIGQSGLRFLVTLTYGAQGQFGPLKAIMDGSGASFGRWIGTNGEVLPPNGIGLALKAGPVEGGGFLGRVGEDEFGGALQVKILGIGAFAYGLYKSLPGGAPSFVVLIGIRLPLPGVQLGFGFAVSGFGGLVGINRRADTDLLRERLTSGSAGDVLFNDDPMRNAPKLLGDMQQFFPSEDGIFLIGPTLQINWLYILTLDAGVFIELPGPRKLFIAGSAKLVIGSESFALVYLRMDFIGGIDFTKSLIFFDAGLVNSHVLGIFRITGGVALRIAYGPNGYFLFTVGGFHPSFNPGPMELPKVARVGVSFEIGPVWLKQEMYLAITSNTFQIGAKVEAGLDLGPIAAHGWFGFDALIQFKPFHFVAQIEAGFDVEVEGVSLCSVRVQGLLSGPGPLVLQARASVKILFVRISGSITIELASNPPETITPIPNIPEHLRKELSNPDNLRIEGEDRGIRLVELDPNLKLVSPVGTLVWEQKRAPLNLKIERLEGIELGGWHTLKVTSGRPPNEEPAEEDWFGVGTYLKLADAEALNTARFAKQASGLRIGGSAMRKGAELPVTIKIHLLKLPKHEKLTDLFPIGVYVLSHLTAVLMERANGAAMPPQTGQVTVSQEVWQTHGPAGAMVSDQNVVQAFVSAKQLGGVALPATEKTLNLAGVL
jgi:hypothetical protein